MSDHPAAAAVARLRLLLADKPEQRPTVSELEAILEQPDMDVEILPDGPVCASQKGTSWKDDLRLVLDNASWGGDGDTPNDA